MNSTSQDRERLTLLHQRLGWSGLLVFSVLGITLEVLLAWKVPFLIDGAEVERRHLLRLGHAHGTLLSLLQLGFCTTIPHLDPERRQTRLGSRLLGSALVLLPLGFVAGGATAAGGDPGIPIVLVPLGALLLLAGVTILTVSLFRGDSPGRS
jgi:hypothetical protein